MNKKVLQKNELALVGDKTQLKKLLQGKAPDLIALFKKKITPEKLFKFGMVAAARTPRLLQCTEVSIINAIIAAGELGLDFSGTTGEGYILPFWNSHINANEARFIPGYQGYIELSYRSGKISIMYNNAVYKDDKFSVELGTSPRIIHNPALSNDRTWENIKCVYNVTYLKGSNVPIIEIMTKEEIDAIRVRSKAKGAGPWTTDPVAMGRKTVIKRAFHYLPKTPDMQRAIFLDNEAESINDKPPAAFTEYEVEPAQDEELPKGLAEVIERGIMPEAQVRAIWDNEDHDPEKTMKAINAEVDKGNS